MNSDEPANKREMEHGEKGGKRRTEKKAGKAHGESGQPPNHGETNNSGATKCTQINVKHVKHTILQSCNGHFMALIISIFCRAKPPP